ELRGCCLVAGSKTDHAVEPWSFYRHLDIVHHQVSRRKDVTAGGSCAVDEIARRCCLDLKGQSTSLSDRLLYCRGHAVEMAVATRKFRRGVDDGDLWLVHIRFGNAQRRPLRLAQSPQSAAA